MDSPIFKGVKGLFTSTTQLTVNTFNAAAGAISGVVSPTGNKGDPSMPSPTKLTVQQEFERPFSTGSPAQKPVETNADFSDFNYWRQPPPPVDLVKAQEDAEEAESFADVLFWKTPQPTLEELEARK